ncbi:MAG TPA: sodium:proton exchanger [Candidatus Omnitrophica bacterium]|nr:sodium:proton exchanger [Candidatus Omnitrophota bacterium]
MNRRSVASSLLTAGVIFFFSAAHVYADTGASESGLIEIVTQLVFQLGVIIIAAWFGGKLFERFSLPAVLGEIVIGALIGPYVLGHLPLPGFPLGLFPFSSGFPVSAELYSIATIASIVLLFLAGLETDIDAFLKLSFVGPVVGIFGVIFSFVLGDLTAVVFSKFLFGAQYGFVHPVPLFLGVISTATSVGISARILSEKKKMDSPEGVTIVASAVIDDVLGIIILAIVIAMAKSSQISWGDIGLISLKALGIWLGFTVAGVLASNHLSQFLKRVFKDKITIAIAALALALLLSGIFERSGLAMIIGAYIMGLSLSKTDLCYVIHENLVVVQKLLVPVFFCVMGMLVNFREMTSPHILLFGLVYLLVAIISKVVGCGFAAGLFGFNFRGSMIVGIGMVPRGEVALIVAGIGLSSGVIPHDAFSVAVMMTFLTTLITPPILAKLVESDKPVFMSRRKVKDERVEIRYKMPNPETADLVLRKTILMFESNGFYVHRIVMDDVVYQIRRNGTFIVLNYDSKQMTFHCKEQDASFIHTLFYEVMAELENTMKKLQTLADKEQIGRNIFSLKTGSKKKEISVSDILSPSAVGVRLDGNTKEEILMELVGLLVRSGQLRYEIRGEILKSLLERESVMSTGMQDGIAMPHVKTGSVKNIITAFGVKKEGVDFGSLDSKPSKIFILTLCPKSLSGPYLQYMAEFSKSLVSENARNSILSCKTSHELYDFLIGAKT